MELNNKVTLFKLSPILFHNLAIKSTSVCFFSRSSQITSRLYISMIKRSTAIVVFNFVHSEKITEDMYISRFLSLSSQFELACLCSLFQFVFSILLFRIASFDTYFLNEKGRYVGVVQDFNSISPSMVFCILL